MGDHINKERMFVFMLLGDGCGWMLDCWIELLVEPLEEVGFLHPPRWGNPVASACRTSDLMHCLTALPSKNFLLATPRQNPVSSEFQRRCAVVYNPAISSH